MSLQLLSRTAARRGSTPPRPLPPQTSRSSSQGSRAVIQLSCNSTCLCRQQHCSESCKHAAQLQRASLIMMCSVHVLCWLVAVQHVLLHGEAWPNPGTDKLQRLCVKHYRTQAVPSVPSSHVMSNMTCAVLVPAGLFKSCSCQPSVLLPTSCLPQTVHEQPQPTCAAGFHGVVGEPLGQS